MKTRAPLASLAVCLGNSNRVFGVLFEPESHHKGLKSPSETHVRSRHPHGFWPIVGTSGPE